MGLIPKYELGFINLYEATQMMNPIHPKPIQTVPSQPLQLPNMSLIPLDSYNPLLWILVLAALLTATEKLLNAVTNLLREIAPFVLDQKRPR
jgi:hypothetical protein